MFSTSRALRATSVPFRTVYGRVMQFSSSSTSGSNEKLRIGYVPEHFSAPLHFAYSKFDLSNHATLRSFPSGTGTMIEAFKAKEIDVSIGLTEAFVVGISKDENRAPAYKMIGRYTQTPLLWAISTGGGRTDMQKFDDIWGKKVGISRMGSGSHIMSSVLAQQHGRLGDNGELPFELVECGPFQPLREAVNSGKADFFMWEVFTSQKFYNNGELKRIGEIETPWTAWHISALGDGTDSRIYQTLLPALEKGIRHFNENKDDSVQFIIDTMEYSKEDAEAWYEGVKFADPDQLKQLDPDGMQKTIDLLRTAGALGSRSISSWKDLAPSI